MKVLVFTTLFPNNVWPDHGVFVKERVSAVARLDGYDIRVIAPVPYYPPIGIGARSAYSRVTRYENIDGIPVYHPRYFMIPKISMPFHGLLLFLSVVHVVNKIKSQFDFDVIDAHFIYPDGFAAVLLGRLLRKPVVVTARGSDINTTANFRTIRPLLKFTLRSAKHITVVSDALRKAIIRLGSPETSVSLISNGVDSAKFRHIPRATAREALGMPLHHKMVLSVGGLNAVKGFDLLIRAFKRLLEDPTAAKCELVIVGEGPMQIDLEQLISRLHLGSRVRLVGRVPHAELYQWYCAADVFCLASEREGRPNVVLEALSCGLPVVATAVGGIPEIINSEAVGLLAVRTECDLADKLGRALMKSWDTQRIVSFAKTYSWQSTAVHSGAVLESVVNDVKVR